MDNGLKLPWDWYDGIVPENVTLAESAYIETAYSFRECRSHRAAAVRLGRGAGVYLAVMFDVGDGGRVVIGDYTSVGGGRLICDEEILIGDYCLISWNVVIMDTYRLPVDAAARRIVLEVVASTTERVLPPSYEKPRPVCIEDNVWIGFDACVLPGVHIGTGSVVAAKSVVSESIPPYTVAGGNPARIIRSLRR
jgi:acetyltransferase-like isoleucine patch superfamily enzyme